MDLENTDNLNTGTGCMTWRIETQKQNCQVEMTLFFRRITIPTMQGASSTKLCLRDDAPKIFQDSDPFRKARKIQQSCFCLFIRYSVPAYLHCLYSLSIRAHDPCCINPSGKNHFTTHHYLLRCSECSQRIAMKNTISVLC